PDKRSTSTGDRFRHREFASRMAPARSRSHRRPLRQKTEAHCRRGEPTAHSYRLSPPFSLYLTCSTSVDRSTVEQFRFEDGHGCRFTSWILTSCASSQPAFS